MFTSTSFSSAYPAFNATKKWEGESDKPSSPADLNMPVVEPVQPVVVPAVVHIANQIAADSEIAKLFEIDQIYSKELE